MLGFENQNPAARPGFALRGIKPNGNAWLNISRQPGAERTNRICNRSQPGPGFAGYGGFQRKQCREGHRERVAAEKCVVDPAPIGEAIFGAHRPVVGDGILDTAADRPAHAGIREVACATESPERNPRRRYEGGTEDGKVSFEPAKGDTARAVDEEAIPGDTKTAANRALDFSSSARRQRRTVWKGKSGGVGQAGSVNGAFKTDDHA